jgi:hypothetical protein
MISARNRIKSGRKKDTRRNLLKDLVAGGVGEVNAPVESDWRFEQILRPRTVQKLERSEFMRLLDNSSAADHRVSGGNGWCRYREIISSVQSAPQKAISYQFRYQFTSSFPGGNVLMTSRFSRREFVAIGVVGVAASSALPAFAASQDLPTLTRKQSADLIRRREASPVELTQACLNRLDKYNPSISRGPLHPGPES